jgi:hypothetical protein
MTYTNKTHNLLQSTVVTTIQPELFIRKIKMNKRLRKSIL